MADIPDSHIDLLRRPIHGVLTTLLPSGQPQSSVVWVDFDVRYPLINTTLERQKGRNMLRDPRAVLLIIDPDDGTRWIEIRGVANLDTQDALSHLDHVTRLYTTHDCYYGRIFPEHQRELETRVICRIQPIRVNCNAVFR